MLRWLLWIAALACTGALLVDTIPADPDGAQTAGPPPASGAQDHDAKRRPLLVWASAGRTQLPHQLEPPRVVSDLPAPLGVCYESVEATATLLAALDRAQQREPDAEAIVHTRHVTDVSLSPGDYIGTVLRLRVHPTWDLEDAHPGFRKWAGAGPPHLNPLIAGEGVIVEVGRPSQGRPVPVGALLESCRNGSAVSPHPRVPGSLHSEFYPTAIMHPLGDADEWRDSLVGSYLANTNAPAKDLANINDTADLVCSVPGGISVHGRKGGLLPKLADPELVRTIRGLHYGSAARRKAACEVALRHARVDLALLVFGYLWRQEPNAFPPRSYAHACPSALPEGDAVAAAIERLAQHKLREAPRATMVLYGLLHPAPQVRAAASRVYCQLMPVDVLAYSNLNPRVRTLLVRWPVAEREELVGKLVARLRSHRVANPYDAAGILAEIVVACELGLLPATSAARSQAFELSVQEILPYVLTNNLSHCRSGRAVLATVGEMGRSSDPDIRRAAWRVRLRLCHAFSEPPPEAPGDPYLEDPRVDAVDPEEP